MRIEPSYNKFAVRRIIFDDLSNIRRTSHDFKCIYLPIFPVILSNKFKAIRCFYYLNKVVWQGAKETAEFWCFWGKSTSLHVTTYISKGS